MMRDPEANPYPQFAGKRVRGTEVFVELVGSRPVRITRMIYFTLTFDENGVLNKELHMRQEMARYNLHINAPIPLRMRACSMPKTGFSPAVVNGSQRRSLRIAYVMPHLGKLKCHRV